VHVRPNRIQVTVLGLCRKIGEALCDRQRGQQRVLRVAARIQAEEVDGAWLQARRAAIEHFSALVEQRSQVLSCGLSQLGRVHNDLVRLTYSNPPERASLAV